MPDIPLISSGRDTAALPTPPGSATGLPLPPYAVCAPLWPDLPHVHAFVTGRSGGVSEGPWGLADASAGGLNLGMGSGDEPAIVLENRRRLRQALPASPHWLKQVHGAAVHVAEGSPQEDPPEADASLTAHPDTVLAVLKADCLPVFLADDEGRVVAVAHAGWRGLAAGVLEACVQGMRQRLPASTSLRAWLGPAIGQSAFEVGDDVHQAFCDVDPLAAACFAPGARAGKWQADLAGLARLRLKAANVDRVDGVGSCTFSDRERFWSYRRDGRCGRMGSIIWMGARDRERVVPGDSAVSVALATSHLAANPHEQQGR